MSDDTHTTLGAVCEKGGGFIRTGPFGSQLHRSDYVDDLDGVPVVMPKDMNGGRIDFSTTARVDQGTASRLSQHLLSVGDIVLARRGDVGRSAWVGPHDVPVLCGTGSMRIHPGSDGPLLPAFLRYVMRSRDVSDYLHGHAVGVTMPNLNAEIVEGLPVTVLPKRQQHSAAIILGALDELIENTRRRVELLEQMAQAIYREWFVHFRYPGHETTALVDSPLGLLPDDWTAPALQDVATVVRGRSYRKREIVDDGGVPFVNLKCMMRGGGFRRDGLKRYNGRYDPDQEVRTGDIVLGVTDLTQQREVLARATLVSTLNASFGVVSLDVARIVPKNSADRLPLYFALRCTDFADRVKEFANGSTVLHLSPSHVAEALVAWPEVRLRQRFHSLADPIVAEQRTLDDVAHRIIGLHDLLLPKLVTGQIDISRLDLDAIVETAMA
jgi:type I restriction enzyme S subunit